jgi:dTDP-4-dehydrorhamnose reductase
MPVSPVLLDDVVRGLCVVASKRAEGVWHFSGPADYSYFEVARSLAVLVGAPLALVEPVYASVQQPPSGSAAFSALGMERTIQQIHLDFPTLDHVLNRLGTSPIGELAGGNTP